MGNVQFAQEIAENQRQAATTELALRSNRRVIRRPVVAKSAITSVAVSPAHQHDEYDPNGRLETDAPVGNAMTQVAEDPNKSDFEMMPSANTALISETSQEVEKRNSSNVVTMPSSSIAVSPMDLPADQFSAALNRRKQNRQLLMEWLRTSLVNGIDYGSIHVVGRDRCQLTQMGRMNECREASHYGKPCLLKPGAEKITGMLGMTVNFPSLPDYEAAVFGEVPITVVILRCELRDAHGHVVAQGVGARHLSQDFGDINKTFKMVEKSAHIDATLRLAGLSEMFTQDLDDRPPTDADANSTGEETAVTSSTPKNRSASTLPINAQPPQSTSSPTARRVVIQPKQTSTATALVKPDQETGEPLVSKADLVTLRAAITTHGFTERRVLSWVMKFTNGAVTNFNQLPSTLCASLLKRLEHWAEAEFFQSTVGTTTGNQERV